ncbi:tail fiber domain-containing protein [Kluyvera cryocrescens]|uniref:phage tail fiber protein n=1 Tax=Kluyvera cryocrescens TaxID=580 RepID=UPI002DB6DCF9|nr:tail fiber domain-containing protein [Kluyvera cryocrescens]MEB7712337.1 tail fiber domain-containing protein [Kluyvera cryocrescens]
MAKIKFKRTSIAGRKPASLESGEIAVNLTDRKIYAGTDNNQIIQLGNDPVITDHLQAKAGATIDSGLVVGGNASVQADLSVGGALVSQHSVKAPTSDIDTITAKSVTTTATTTGTLTATGKTTLGETKTGALEATTANITGAVTVHSLMTPGSVSAGGNIVATGKVSSGSVETGAVTATGDVSSPTVTTSGKAKSGSVETGAVTASDITATGKVKSVSVETGSATVTGTATVHNLVITGSSNVTGGVSASGKLVGSSLETPLITTTDINTRNVTATGVVTAPTVTGTAVNAGTLTATGLTSLKMVKSDSLETLTITATGAVHAGSLVASTVTSTGLATLKTVKTDSVESGSVTTTGAGVIGTTLTVGGASSLKAVTANNITATGNITASGMLKSATGEITSLIAGSVSATGAISASSLSAGSITLTDFTNFDARYIKTGTSMPTADRLSSPRTIAGVAFDGSANISIPAANVGALPVAGGTMNGSIAFNTTQADYDMASLNNGTTGGKSYLRKFRGGSGDVIWHETVAGGFYRLATGNTDVQEEFNLSTSRAQFRSEVVSQNANGFRIAYGNYGMFVRNDGNNTYFMLTASGDAYGSYNALRPLAISNSTGVVSIGNGLNVAGSATFSGAVAANAGLTSTTVTASGRVTGAGVTSTAGVAVGGSLTGATTGAFSGAVSMAGLTASTGAFSGRLNATAGIGMAANQGISSTTNGSMILNDHGNGNVTLCAARTASTATVGGELYLGYNASAGAATDRGFYTSKVGVYAPMTTSSTLTVAGVGTFSSTLNVTGLLTGTGNGSFADVQIRSDKRLKTNLVKVDTAMDKVKKLTAYHYNKRSDLESDNYDVKEVGIIAQDLEEVLPEAVITMKNGIKVISVSAVNALMVNALNEINKRIEHLEYLEFSKH